MGSLHGALILSGLLVLQETESHVEVAPKVPFAPLHPSGGVMGLGTGASRGGDFVCLGNAPLGRCVTHLRLVTLAHLLTPHILTSPYTHSGQVCSYETARAQGILPGSRALDPDEISAMEADLVCAIVLFEGCLPTDYLIPSTHHFVHYGLYTMSHASLRLFWMMFFERYVYVCCYYYDLPCSYKYAFIL